MTVQMLHSDTKHVAQRHRSNSLTDLQDIVISDTEKSTTMISNRKASVPKHAGQPEPSQSLGRMAVCSRTESSFTCYITMQDLEWVF